MVHEAVILSAVRTPFGRYNGVLRDVRPDDLAALVVGGVESMSRAPFVMGKAETAFPRGNITLQDTTLGWRFINPRLAEMYHPYSMGETAENVASKYDVSRGDQDLFALHR